MQKSLSSCGEGWGKVDKNLFYFYKEKNVDGREIDEHILTGELLYNNEDCSIKPKSKCQKKNRGNYKVQSATAVGRFLLRASFPAKGEAR